MGGDPARRNQSLYCTYHKEKGHTTKQCRVLKDHLEQLGKARHLKEFVVGQEVGSTSQGSGSQGNTILPPLGIIKVIHATSIGVSMSHQRGILSIVTPPETEVTNQPKKKLKKNLDMIAFGEVDLEGTSQPHNDVLVVTSRISGFLVKRVMIDQGNGVEIMYPNLYNGLGLKLEDLSKYDTPLVGFDGKEELLEGRI